MLWDITLRMVVDMPMIDSSWSLSVAMSDEFLERLKKAMLYDYIQSLDITKNTIWFGGTNEAVLTKPRRTVPEKINQFDINRLMEEMKEVLNHGRKRAFAFVGRQGVGKSSILRVIEERFTEYMVIHLTPDDFNSARTIIERFSIAKMFQPVIIIIEDLDSCELKTKNAKTGAFLDCIDDVNNDLHAVILVSINDTGMVHQTIINRPGRFDRVFEVLPPSTIQEAFEVVLSKVGTLSQSYCGDTPFELSDGPSICMENNLRKCLEHRFTQAELTNAVTEQVFIDIGIEISHGTPADGWEAVSVDMFDQHFGLAIDKHLATKKAIQAFRFNSEIGDTCGEDGICPGKAVEAYGTPIQDYRTGPNSDYGKTERRNELLRNSPI